MLFNTVCPNPAVVVVKKTTSSESEDWAGWIKYQRVLSSLYTLTVIELGSTLYPAEIPCSALKVASLFLE